jgi:hypothetical protein
MSTVPLRSRNWLLHGREMEPDSPVRLRSGPLQLLYEPSNGFLRRICLGEKEVLRGIYAAVRDRNWGTVSCHLHEVKREVAPDSFLIEFESDHRWNDIHFQWRGTIEGNAEGTIRYGFDGEAKSTFLRNRIGFCVLHPVRECAGAVARQTRVDGKVVECRFPDTIEPQIFGKSSFRELRAVAHEVVPGLWAEAEFEGDVFEMEDQRNWTDASFKTYCTPLARPFPEEIKFGTRVRQRVTLRLMGEGPVISGNRVEVVEDRAEVVTVTVGGAPVARCPEIGLSMAYHGQALTPVEIGRLRALRLAHLRVDLRLSSPDWRVVWELACREAKELGVRLEVAFHLRPGREGGSDEVRQLLREQSEQLACVLALREGEPATSPQTLKEVKEYLTGLGVPVGAGSDSNFCELNREQALGSFGGNGADFLFWPINPQVHAFDSLSIVETLEAQSETVRTARSFAQGLPLSVSPVVLKPRFNPAATVSSPPISPDELPSQVDPRQLSLFAAAWTLGSIAALAGTGVGRVTFYETTGWRGVMEQQVGSSRPSRFPSTPGSVFPLYHVFAEYGALKHLCRTSVDSPSQVAALSGRSRDGRLRVLLGNLTPQTRQVRLLSSGLAWRLRGLSEKNAAVAILDPERFLVRAGQHRTSRDGSLLVTLPPHGIVSLDEVPPGGEAEPLKDRT